MTLEDEDALTPVRLVVNGEARDLSVHDDEALVWTLPNRLGLTSVRATCGIGICGTCAVQVDGRAVSSCLMLTRQVAGRELVTSEGLAGPDGQLHRVQQAFVEARAYQCSYCIPAMAVTVDACLRQEPDADAETVREHLAGNLCRCGTYPMILEAVARLVTDD